jgi:hypothetical protein
MHMAELLNQRLDPRTGRRPRWFCDTCKVVVNPKVDSQGPHCPYCQADLVSPMEQTAPTKPLPPEPGR